MTDDLDIKYMQRALDISLKGSGFVNTNPLVGAVIVKENQIIGEGYHEKFGRPHAEINAILNSITDIKGSTLYVTVEPCDHQGKTPPCTDRIILEEFSRVVIGMKDPNKLVNGKGILKLINTGIEVKTGILENEIRKANEVFIKFITSILPFVAMKTAMTLDGKISTYSGDSKWISNEQSRKMVHNLRHEYSAVMVGVNTVINDNPLLTDRSDHINKSHPVRIIVDSNGRTPLTSKILNTRLARTIIAITDQAPDSFVKSISKLGIEIILCPEKNQKVDLGFLIKELGKRGIDSILLEGGSTLNFSALTAGIVDKVYSFISPKLIGGENALTPVGGQGFKKINEAIILNIADVKRFDDDIMIEAYIIKK